MLVSLGPHGGTTKGPVGPVGLGSGWDYSGVLTPSESHTLSLSAADRASLTLELGSHNCSATLCLLVPPRLVPGTGAGLGDGPRGCTGICRHWEESSVF